MAQVGQIQAKIHLIKAVDGVVGVDGGDAREQWVKTTKKQFLTYQGSGIHYDMLKSGYLEKNAGIIAGILADK